jgi:hypothetical protein
VLKPALFFVLNGGGGFEVVFGCIGWKIVVKYLYIKALIGVLR